ncbi:hypothetical protein Hanom_Chr16g01487721 [Helianthus anomalus]
MKLDESNAESLFKTEISPRVITGQSHFAWTFSKESESTTQQYPPIC